MTTTTDYDKQATDFLKKTGVTFEAKFLEYGIHFDSDKDKRDIYQITLKRGQREFIFNFGQSINASGKYVVGDKIIADPLRNAGLDRFRSEKLAIDAIGKHHYYIMNKQTRELYFKANPDYSEPNEYSVLACLAKCDPIDFENFCGEFGYDTDSKRAEKTYKAVRNEYQNVCMLWSDSEIEELQEIQ